MKCPGCNGKRISRWGLEMSSCWCTSLPKGTFEEELSLAFVPDEIRLIDNENRKTIVYKIKS